MYANTAKQWRPWSDAAFCGFWSGSAVSHKVPKWEAKHESDTTGHFIERINIAEKKIIGSQLLVPVGEYFDIEETCIWNLNAFTAFEWEQNH